MKKVKEKTRARDAGINKIEKEENKFVSRKFLISLISLFFLILFAFLITDGYLNLNRDEKIYTAGAKDMIDQRMTYLLSEMNIFPKYIGNDLLFLSRLSSLKSVINFSEDENRTINDLERDFLEFLKGSTVYYQLMYIDEKGDEIIRVEFNGINYKTIPKDKLQNKKQRDYFKEAINFAEGEIYVSQLDLNIENELIENRGTEKNPVYIPVMKAATPVFNGAGASRGIILFNIYADYFLNDIRRAQREGETVFLINKNGYYLSHPDKSKEFGFILGKEDNFFSDYPEISREMLMDSNKRRFETEDFIFSFIYTHPTAGDAGIHRNSEKILEKNYSWILVTVSDKTEINYGLNKLKKDYLYFLLFSGIMVLVILGLVFALAFKTSVNGGEHRSKYISEMQDHKTQNSGAKNEK